MKSWWGVLALACVGGAMAAKAAPRVEAGPVPVMAPLVAVVKPLDLAQHQIEVSLALPAEATEKGAVLALPAWTPGSYMVRDYARFLDRLVLKDASGHELPAPPKLDKQRWQLPALKGGGSLSYRIYGNDLTVRTNHIDAAHAHLVGAGTFAYLEGQLKRPYEVRFEGFPQDWQVATGLEQKGGAYAAPDYDTLVDSPFELGTFHLHRFRALDADFEFAITGRHNGDEARIVSDAQKVVTAAGGIFGGFPFKRYVFLLTFSPRVGGGLEHKNSTSLLMDPFAFEKEDGYHGLASLVAHEFFHAWNVKRLHDPVLGPFDYSQENYTRQLWFHEGCTSYMEDVIVLRAGVVPWSFAAGEIARNWTEQLKRPGRLEQSLEESSYDAWIRGYKPTEFSYNSSIDYYGKGQAVGLLMEAALRRASQGKAGMPELFAWLWKERGEKGVTDADLRAAFKAVSGGDPEPFWDKYVRGRAELDGSAVEQAFGLKFQAKAPWEQLPKEDAEALRRAKAWSGLSFQGGPAAPSALVQNVVPGSPADAAGLAYGMEVLAVDGWRTPTGADAQKRLADAGVGAEAELLAADRGQVFKTRLRVAEDPTRSWSLVVDPAATEAQKAAFKAWTGQDFPPAPVAPKKSGSK